MLNRNLLYISWLAMSADVLVRFRILNVQLVATMADRTFLHLVNPVLRMLNIWCWWLSGRRKGHDKGEDMAVIFKKEAFKYEDDGILSRMVVHTVCPSRSLACVVCTFRGVQKYEWRLRDFLKYQFPSPATLYGAKIYKHTLQLF